MRKALLLYNPLSGRRTARRSEDVHAALSVLRAAGVEATSLPTGGSAEAAEKTRRAVAEGCDTIVACGGDGTIHDILQGLIGSNAALGIIPLGTANALARDLRLPLAPIAAARAALAAKPRRVGVGRVEYQDLSGKTSTRYFTVTVGIGADAHLFYKLNPELKSRLGMAAYYAKATGLWLTHPFQDFSVELSGKRQLAVTQLLAVRIRNFGGVLRELAPGASLDNNDLRLVLFQTHSRIAYLRYIIRGLVGARWEVSRIELASAETAVCRPLSGGKIFLEADGELLGTLPATLSMIPDALSLLVP